MAVYFFHNLFTFRTLQQTSTVLGMKCLNCNQLHVWIFEQVTIFSGGNSLPKYIPLFASQCEVVSSLWHFIHKLVIICELWLSNTTHLSKFFHKFDKWLLVRMKCFTSIHVIVLCLKMSPYSTFALNIRIIHIKWYPERIVRYKQKVNNTRDNDTR